MKHKVYISLGSNIGNRLEYLQRAVEAISWQVGRVQAISKVYETSAWGFQGASFLNACIVVKTQLVPDIVIEKLLSIEQQLGRIRTQGKGYQSRPIDIDILFFDQEIISTKKLQIPHPHIQDRKFVLQPLADIAPELLHPMLGKTISKLLKETNDLTPLSPTNFSIYSTHQLFDRYKYIVIEGNIGVGKTTLATKISEFFSTKLILEQFADNPFLPKFYEDAQRYGFSLEMFFLMERYQQMTEYAKETNLFMQPTVADYDIFKSLIFSSVTLTDDEYMLYEKYFYSFYNQIIKPKLYVYLHQSTERLLSNIKKRGRSFEQNISANYLEQISKAYLYHIEQNKSVNSLIIDVTEMDFVENEADFQKILRLMQQSNL